MNIKFLTNRLITRHTHTHTFIYRSSTWPLQMPHMAYFVHQSSRCCFFFYNYISFIFSSLSSFLSCVHFWFSFIYFILFIFHLLFLLFSLIFKSRCYFLFGLKALSFYLLLLFLFRFFFFFNTISLLCIYFILFLSFFVVLSFYFIYARTHTHRHIEMKDPLDPRLWSRWKIARTHGYIHTISHKYMHISTYVYTPASAPAHHDTLSQK